MTRVLGIDPGSRVSGYGVVDQTSNGIRYIASGCIRMQHDSMPDRLKKIFDGVSELINIYQPDQVAIEQIFMHKNADSALKLGMARGAIMCATMQQNLPIYEYAARQVKLALVGKGSADKHQVQHMIKVLLGIQGEMPMDASDALAIAMCHIHHQQSMDRYNQVGA